MDPVFTMSDMKDAFNAGFNRGVDVTLIIEHNGKHPAISGYPHRTQWMKEKYNIKVTNDHKD